MEEGEAITSVSERRGSLLELRAYGCLGIIHLVIALLCTTLGYIVVMGISTQHNSFLAISTLVDGAQYWASAATLA